MIALRLLLVPGADKRMVVLPTSFRYTSQFQSQGNEIKIATPIFKSEKIKQEAEIKDMKASSNYHEFLSSPREANIQIIESVKCYDANVKNIFMIEPKEE